MAAQPPSGVPTVNRRSKWLCVDMTGVKSIIQADKRTLLQLYDLTIPIRDMRWLDPNLTTAHRGNIAVRDAAIVFSIEYVQVIITAERVILPQGALARVEHTEFVDKLVATIREAALARQQLDEEGEQASLESGSLANSFNPDLPYQPFELVALEVALKEVCQSYAMKAKQLEATISPACEALLKRVQTKTLENLRRLKTRHQRLLASVTTVRDELESFLKDDDDIAKMCLSRKLEASHEAGRAMLRHPSVGRTESGHSPTSSPRTPRYQRSGSMSPRAQKAEEADLADEVAAEEVENLLESYFIQIDRTYNRLTSLEEFMKDTESYINIDLDSSQNRLFRLDIVLTALAFSMEIFHVTAGILGENVPIPEQITQNVSQFWIVNICAFFICICIFIMLYSYLRYKRLLL